MRKTGEGLSKELRVLLLFVALFIMFLLLFWTIHPGAFVIVLALSAASNLATFHFVSMHLRKKTLYFLTQYRPVITPLMYILLINTIYSFNIFVLRISDDFHTAMLLSIPLLLETYIVFISLSDTLMNFPRKVFSEGTIQAIRYGLFFSFIVFLMPVYIYRVLSHTYEGHVERIMGLYPELFLIQTGFGSIHILAAGLTFITLLFLAAVSTYQLFSLKNRSIRSYFISMWIAFISSISITIIGTFIMGTHLGLNGFIPYPIQAGIFMPIVTYFLMRMYVLELKTKGIKPVSRSESYVELHVSDDGSSLNARRVLLDHIRRGRSALVFSYESPEEIFGGPVPDSVIYIHISQKGYEIGGVRFRSMQDIRNSPYFPASVSGMVVYLNSLSAMEENRIPLSSVTPFYMCFRDMMGEGALILSPVHRKNMTIPDVEVLRTRHPTWYVKPLIVIRLYESIMALREHISDDKMEDFIRIISSIRGEGIPNMTVSKEGDIDMDLNANMDHRSFITAISTMREKLADSGMISTDSFDSIMSEVFHKHDEDYEALVLVKKGLVYLITGTKPERDAIEKANFLSATGRKVLIISRTNPDILRETRVIERSITVKWLTNMPGREGVVLPHLESIKKEIFEFTERKDALVVLDGIEHLTRLHGFGPILDFLWIVKDRVSTTGANLLIPVNLDALEKIDAESLRREFHTLGSGEGKNKK